MVVVAGYVPRHAGLAALEAALAEAGRTGERLVVVNAGAEREPWSAGLADPRDIDATCRGLAVTGVAYEVRQPCRGRPPAVELIEAAEATGARLVVVGLRRESPLGTVGSRSTAQRVLLDAACDVLAVRPAP